LEGLEADKNCPKCGLPIKESVIGASYTFAHLPLRQQPLFLIALTVNVVAWLSFYSSGSRRGVLGPGPYKLPRAMWHLAFLMLMPLTPILFVQCLRFLPVFKRGFLRIANYLAYIAMFFASAFSILVFLSYLSVV